MASSSVSQEFLFGVCEAAQYFSATDYQAALSSLVLCQTRAQCVAAAEDCVECGRGVEWSVPSHTIIILLLEIGALQTETALIFAIQPPTDDYGLGGIL